MTVNNTNMANMMANTNIPQNANTPNTQGASSPSTTGQQRAVPQKASMAPQGTHTHVQHTQTQTINMTPQQYQQITQQQLQQLQLLQQQQNMQSKYLTLLWLTLSSASEHERSSARQRPGTTKPDTNQDDRDYSQCPDDVTQWQHRGQPYESQSAPQRNYSRVQYQTQQPYTFQGHSNTIPKTFFSAKSDSGLQQCCYR